MNNTTNSNSTIDYFNYDLEFWLPQFASTWALDSIFLFIITPLALSGVVLNVLTLIILCQKKFQQNKINHYFRCIALNSAVMNLTESTIFVCSTYRYFEFSNTFESNAFGLHVYLPISNSCYIFGSCLDILVSLERCSIFVTRLKRLFEYKVKYVCLVLFVVCVLITSPFFFVEEPAYFDAPIYPKTYYRIWYWGLNSFGNSLAGKVLAAIGYFVRDVCFLAAEVAVNIYSIYLFKKFFKSRASLFNLDKTEGPLSNLDAALNMPFNVRVTIAERKMTLMVIILCFFSIFMHLLYMTTTVYFYFSYDLIINSIGAASVLTTTSKNAANFFLLYIFNTNFRKCFIKKFIFG